MDKDWTCIQCTLSNPASRSACEACGAECPAVRRPEIDVGIGKLKLEEWTCSRCTLSNPLSRTECGACGADRPSVQQPKRVPDVVKPRLPSGAPQRPWPSPQGLCAQLDLLMFADSQDSLGGNDVNEAAGRGALSAQNRPSDLEPASRQESVLSESVLEGSRLSPLMPPPPRPPTPRPLLLASDSATDAYGPAVRAATLTEPPVPMLAELQAASDQPLEEPPLPAFPSTTGSAPCPSHGGVAPLPSTTGFDAVSASTTATAIKGPDVALEVPAELSASTSAGWQGTVCGKPEEPAPPPTSSAATTSMSARWEGIVGGRPEEPAPPPIPCSVAAAAPCLTHNSVAQRPAVSFLDALMDLD